MWFLLECNQPIATNVFVRNYPEIFSESGYKKQEGLCKKNVGQ